jgi:hypothetical protein
MIIIFAIVLSLIHDFRILSIMSSHTSWQIHSIFSVAQLESASDSAQNLYNRLKSIHSSSVTNTQNEYEIERILNKRTVKRDHEYFTKYLVRWLDYEFEFDRWYNVKNLENVKELITNYEKKLLNNFNWLIMTRLFNIINTVSFLFYHFMKSSWSFQNEINWKLRVRTTITIKFI